MFAKLFALFFSKKKEPEPTPTIAQRMEQRRRTRDLYDNAAPMRVGKARSTSGEPASTCREDDIMSNPIHPLNPLNPIGFNSPVYYDSTPSESSRSSSSYDCGSSSSSSYDSGSSSCDSGSSSSGGD